MARKSKKSPASDPLARIASILPSATTNFSEVTPAAQPAIAAILARQNRAATWIICPDVRRQEEFAADLLAWGVTPTLFPELEPLTDSEGIPDPEILSERLEILARLAADEPLCLILTAAQPDAPVPAAAAFRADQLVLAAGQRHDLPALGDSLTAAGYESVPKIFARGQFARRGGILDIFSWQHALPVRIEFFDDEIESIRRFHLDSQTSVETLPRCEILTSDTDPRDHVPLETYRRKRDLTILIDPEAPFDSANTAIISQSEIQNQKSKIPFHPPGIDVFEAGDLILNEAKRNRFFAQLREWITDDWHVVLVCNNEGEWERFSELARDNALDPTTLHFREGSLTAGFSCPAARLAVLSDAELFGRSASQRARRQWIRRERAAAARGGMDFTEFEPGDLVVHLDHGIGKFHGIEKLPTTPGSDSAEEVLTITFADEARLFVPLDQAWQVSRYVGLGRKNPPLSQLGDGKWQRAIKKAERSIFEYANTMLRLQAERDTSAGHSFGPDTHWQHEFESSFIFTPTVDQARAIEESKQDMESTRPMDRLICGDVGFGKTEVAIRSIFKAVMSGKQAALLAPTTVLAQQHYHNLRERMSEYPVTIEALHRYRTRGEQNAVVKGLLDGSVDIVVGTHRLLSNDVAFKDLGLVVVDEEQRFGVKHKELLKDRFRLIDVLTLSATPIPRTLYLALMGARDMSLIETPPPNRQPVETIICAYDERVMRDAIARELKRGGQVYLLHNRVKTIEKLALRIRELCPKARVGVGHGQMPEHELEGIMQAFVAGDLDVLVSTTIIESGLDIPNANTIIIDRADRFGLADLYQLRGRVGRSHHKAHAYLMLPRDMLATGDARKRVQAIRQYSELGAGFKIAMRDLEIRGAGNILGTAQSGHILAVGFDLYCKMLKRSVSTIQGTRSGPATSVPVRLDFLCTNEPEFSEPTPASAAPRLPVFLPSRYVTDSRARIEAYRKLADAADPAALDALRTEWADRYGPVPPAADHLLTYQKIRLAASARRLRLVEVRENKLMIQKKDDYILFGGKFPRLTSPNPENKLREVLAYLENRLLS